MRWLGGSDFGAYSGQPPVERRTVPDSIGLGEYPKAETGRAGTAPHQASDLHEKNPRPSGRGFENCGQGRGRTADLPLFRRSLVPTELPGQDDRKPDRTPATQTGLEPATFAVTGRRANQLRHWALLLSFRAPNGIRTRATALKGRGPRPLDDEDSGFLGPPTRDLGIRALQRPSAGSTSSIERAGGNLQIRGHEALLPALSARGRAPASRSSPDQRPHGRPDAAEPVEVCCATLRGDRSSTSFRQIRGRLTKSTPAHIRRRPILVAMRPNGPSARAVATDIRPYVNIGHPLAFGAIAREQTSRSRRTPESDELSRMARWNDRPSGGAPNAVVPDDRSGR